MNTIATLFKVVTVSSNTNAFGLHGVVLVDKTGIAYEVGMNYLSVPQTGAVLQGYITPNGNLSSLEGKSYEIPRKLPSPSKEVLNEIWKQF